MGICSASKNIWGSVQPRPNDCAKTGTMSAMRYLTYLALCSGAVAVRRDIQHNHIVTARIFGDFMG